MCILLLLLLHASIVSKRLSVASYEQGRTITKFFDAKNLGEIPVGRGRGATESRGSVDPPLFEVRGPHMGVDPHFCEDQLVHECC